MRINVNKNVNKIGKFLALIFFSAVLFGMNFAMIANAASTDTYKVSAWMPSWDIEEATDSFESNADVIDTLSPFWYHVNTDGTLTTVMNGEDMNIIRFAQSNNVEIIPTISNSFDWKVVHEFLNDSEEKKKNIARIVDKVNFFNYDGIDIDYEGLLSSDKDAFTSYIRDLSAELKKHNKKLTIAIQAKTYDKIAIYGDFGQDWKAIHPYVDEFRIMTYDYGWRGSVPRPIAPYYWVEDVIEYALDNVPKEKIFLGVPFYGGGWSDGYFYNYTYDTIKLILDRYGVDFQYDPTQKTNKLYYVSNQDSRDVPVPHEVWFENSVSLEPKLDLVKKYDLGGIAIWRLGKEDTRNWKEIRKILKGEPLTETLYFRDVNQNTANFEAITRLAELGIVRGQDKSDWFKPYDKVNRAEILKMTLNSFARDTSNYMFEDIIAEAQAALEASNAEIDESATGDVE
ncbi:S-layer homology domain-containing protein, partial [Patescibacteria group bacterium]|nr:S-layer homology domain-containing protein [Patescibacteria group bacterium]